MFHSLLCPQRAGHLSLCQAEQQQLAQNPQAMPCRVIIITNTSLQPVPAMHLTSVNLDPAFDTSCQESTWLYLLITWGCASEGRMREGRWEERLGWRGEILGGIRGGFPDEPKPMVE